MLILSESIYITTNNSCCLKVRFKSFFWFPCANILLTKHRAYLFSSKFKFWKDMHSDEEIKSYVYDHLDEVDLSERNDLGEVKMDFELLGEDGKSFSYTVFLEKCKSDEQDWLVRTIVRADEVRDKE